MNYFGLSKDLIEKTHLELEKVKDKISTSGNKFDD
jgi:hypothetical protein